MHIQLSSPGSTGQPGIPETAVIESISRGELDASPARGHDGLPAVTIRLRPVSKCEND
jgi:hypothetical protein